MVVVVVVVAAAGITSTLERTVPVMSTATCAVGYAQLHFVGLARDHQRTRSSAVLTLWDIATCAHLRRGARSARAPSDQSRRNQREADSAGSQAGISRSTPLRRPAS